MSVDPYPLRWPDGWPRTKSPVRSQFKVASFVRVRDSVYRQLELMGATRVVITSNLPTKLDGKPYANAGEPGDGGIAVWWVETGREQVMACDRWDRIRDNLRAIELSLGALRGLERWGSTEIAQRAFAGFAALPAAEHDWRSVLGHPHSLEEAKARYRELARASHPDRGGSEEAMRRLNLAFAVAEQELAS